MTPERFQRFKQLVQEALELQEEERQAFLDVACAGEPELRAQAEGFLARKQEVPSGFLEAPVAGMPGARAADRTPSAPEAERASPPGPPSGPMETDSAGPRVPGYEILGKLGQGGMGVVYKARDCGLDRTVALKVILSGSHASATDLARFLTDAQALARLQHPNIVQLFEWGQHDGLPYFTLEYVPGGSLADKLRGTPLPPGEAARLVEQLARAVHCAHQKEIIHRDLKPGNVLLAEDGTPKVTDFGLAKRVEGGGGLTATGAVMGTPSYMAPEQAEGNKEIGPAADVYALGAILYECLTGRPPFQGPETLNILMQVVQDEPVPPTRLQPGVPRDLETICLKCLEKKPEKRYAIAGQLAERLRMFLEGKPIPDRPVGAMEKSWKWAKRRPAVAVAYALLLTAAVMGSVGGVAAWLWQQSESARQQEGVLRGQAEEARQEAEVARQQAETARQHEGVLRGHAEEARQVAEKARDDLDKALEELQAVRYARNLQLALREWEAFNIVSAEAILDDCPKELRQWEWRHLKACCRRRALTFKGHTDRVVSVAFSPDGQRLASGSHDGMVKVWDARSGQEMLSFKAHSGVWVWSVAFSRDGERLASGGSDRMVKVWDARTGKGLHSLQGHTDIVTSVAFSPDGQRLASGSWDKTVKVWNPMSGEELFSLPEQTGRVTSVAFSPNGQRLASGSFDQTVKVWELGSLKNEPLTIKQPGQVSGVAFSPDGLRLVSGSDLAVTVWDARSGKQLQSFKRDYIGSSVTSLAFSSDGQCLALGSDDGRVQVWDAQSGQKLRSLLGHTDHVKGVAFSPDGQRLASFSVDETVTVWDLGSGEESLPIKHTANAYGVAFSPDGQRLASGAGVTVKVWDVRNGQEVFSRQGHKSNVCSVAFSPDGRHLASASFDTTVKVWDATNGKELHCLREHTGAVSSVAFSPDGQHLASGSWDGTVKVWDATSGKELRSLRGHTGQVMSVAFSPDGKRLASGSFRVDKGRVLSPSGEVKVWDATTGRELVSNRQHTDAVSSVAFSPDGQRLASGGWLPRGTSLSGQVKVWDATNGQELLSYGGYTRRVRSIAFSPDGQRLVSGGDDGMVRVWDARRGRQLLSLQEHTSLVESVTFSPDGQRLASSGFIGGMVKVRYAPAPAK